MPQDRPSVSTVPPFDHAVGLLQQGNLAGAEQLCFQILAAAPAHFQAVLLLGAIRSQQGRNAEALALIGDALKIHPDDTGALLNYGNVLKALGRDQEALAFCDKALAVKPDHGGAWYNRGNILLRLKHFDQALASFEKAVALRPDFAPAWNHHGLTLQAMKRSEDALASYDRALGLNPNNAEVLNNRGAALFSLKRRTEALDSYDKALGINPRLAEALNNRGTALYTLDRWDEALAAYDRAVSVKPDYADAWHNRGKALRDARRFAEAVTSYDRALRLDPANAEIWNDRAACLYYLGHAADALASYDRALAIDPDFTKALRSRATLLWKERRDYQAATLDLEKTLIVEPDFDYAAGDLLHLRMHGTDWRDFEQQAAQLAAGVRAGKRVALPFIYLAISDSPEDLQTCAIIYSDHLHPPGPVLWKKSGHRRDKIRLGYMSGEFRNQATAFLTAGLYECHDKDRFELVAIDNGRSDGSSMRRRLEASFDRFIPIGHLSDRAAAEKIVAEDIDILVNLNGYFGEYRMEVFAHRPAPVQVNYLGFPATLGASYIDYILADRFVIPKNEERFYTEKVVTLPGSYQVNDSRRHLAAARPDRAAHQLPEQAFVFCNFNMSYKITPENFAAWMRILKQVDGSVLWLLQSNLVSPANLRREAERHGIAGDRLIFAPFTSMEEQLNRLPLADLFLDTMPCNAHTTASDALWVGVPLITCTGTTFSGRVAASLLNAVDLPELVTANWQDYEALAVKLATDPALLHAIRQKLARNRQTTPLFDTDRTRRHIESAYAKMWEIFQRGEAPQSFEIEAEA
jgi:predicted O-linked N-acetylglucosamine transferase (SPINDLY family)